jgi:hypothetical protein
MLNYFANLGICVKDASRQFVDFGDSVFFGFAKGDAAQASLLLTDFIVTTHSFLLISTTTNNTAATKHSLGTSMPTMAWSGTPLENQIQHKHYTSKLVFPWAFCKKSS